MMMVVSGNRTGSDIDFLDHATATVVVMFFGSREETHLVFCTMKLEGMC